VRLVYLVFMLSGLLIAESAVSQDFDTLVSVDSVYRTTYLSIQSELDSIKNIGTALPDSLRATYEHKIFLLDSLRATLLSSIPEAQLMSRGLPDVADLDITSLPNWPMEENNIPKLNRLESEITSLDLTETLSNVTTEKIKIPGELSFIQTGMELESLKAQGKQEAITHVNDLSGLELQSDSLSLSHVTSQAATGLQQRVESHASSQEVQQYLDKENSLLKESIGGLMNADRQEVKVRLVQAGKAFVNSHTQEITEVHEQIKNVKEEYSKVLNSEDLNTAIRQNSLEEQSISQRLTYGANVNIINNDPFGIDLAALGGYMINRQFQIGVTASYRLLLQRDDLKLSQDQLVWGYSFYLSHTVYKNFFGFLEAENKIAHLKNDESSTSVGNPGLLAGIGRQFQISTKGRIQVMILYNFLYEENGVYQSPFVLKTGFQIQ